MLYLIIIILIIIVVVVLVLNSCTTCGFSESYGQPDEEPFMGNCETCEDRPIGECLKCLNCGFISKDGFGKCVKGDAYGPLYFDPSYVGARWITGDQYWSNVVLTDDIAVPTTRVYSRRYPLYQRFSTDQKFNNPLKKLKYPKNIDHHYPYTVQTDGGQTLQDHATGVPYYDKK
jgi:hypothetical protein